MIDQIVESNVAYAVGGGLVYATLFALKAVQSGQPFSEIKFGITLVLAAVIGLVFEVIGYDPSAYDWFAVLFAFSGMIATLEQSAKLAARGYYGEARDKASAAAREGADAATDLVGGEEVARREVEQRLPDGVRPAADADEQYARAREDLGGYRDPVDHTEGVDDEERREFIGLGSPSGDDDSEQRRDSNEVVTDGP